MELPFVVPGYDQYPLLLRTATALKSARILHDGQVLPRKWRTHMLTLSDGTQIPLKLKYNCDLLVPKVKFQDELIELLPPLKFYEYIWCITPFILLLVGGKFWGALLGIPIAYYYHSLFHDPIMPTSMKWILSFAALIGGFVALLIIGFLLYSLFYRK